MDRKHILIILKNFSIMVNKIILVGHVGKDPEVRRMDNNLVCSKFSLATKERWTAKDGIKTEHTEWHNIVLWRNLAEAAEKYVRKGALLYIDGKVRSHSYDDKDGIKRYVTEVIADTMNILSSRSNGTSQQSTSTVQESIDTQLDAPPPEDLPF